ncbi:MAG: hypothetical protein MK212_21335, partial [Saprospiraceae bacterium]|nr:hypothetical protein [Saprospiraceae bacterium]
MARVLQICKIEENQIWLNGTVVFEQQQLTYAQFIKAAYKHYNLQYPKFNKMDRLCKLAFIAACILVENGVLLEGYASEEMAIVMANANSTLYTDSRHCDTIQSQEEYYPSPSIFVYTLPNITVGEISIRFKMKGETVFFVADEFDRAFMIDYAGSLLDDN